MKKRIIFLICSFILCFTRGCSNNSNLEGTQNEFGSYISFKKVSTTKNIQLMKDVTMYVPAFEYGGHLNIENNNHVFLNNDKLVSALQKNSELMNQLVEALNR